MSKYDTIYKALMSNPDVNIAKITQEDHKVGGQGDIIRTYGILDGSLKDAKDTHNFLELDILQRYLPRM